MKKLLKAFITNDCKEKEKKKRSRDVLIRAAMLKNWRGNIGKRGGAGFRVIPGNIHYPNISSRVSNKQYADHLKWRRHNAQAKKARHSISRLSVRRSVRLSIRCSVIFVWFLFSLPPSPTRSMGRPWPCCINAAAQSLPYIILRHSLVHSHTTGGVMCLASLIAY